MIFMRFIGVLSALAAFGVATPALAQVPPNCTVETVTGPDRQVLKCAFGLILEMDAAAEMIIPGEILASEPTNIDLQSGAVFVDVEPGAARPQIKTPHAIAAVRGTVYVVDVSADVTSVFVVEGEVSVSRAANAAAQVTLGPGEGVDVGPDPDLTVGVWSDSRVKALMARFGR